MRGGGGATHSTHSLIWCGFSLIPKQHQNGCIHRAVTKPFPRKGIEAIKTNVMPVDHLLHDMVFTSSPLFQQTEQGRDRLWKSLLHPTTTTTTHTKFFHICTALATCVCFDVPDASFIIEARRRRRHYRTPAVRLPWALPMMARHEWR